jgi:flagellar basal-body rod protein FlgB
MIGVGNSLFEKTQVVLQKSLDANTLRWNVLSNNLANVNTPNFKRSDVTFASQMKRALDSENVTLPFEAKKTSTKHFSFEDKIDYKDVNSKIQTEFYTETNNNNNNVDAGFESGEALKTSLLYNSTTEFIQRDFNLVNEMIK